MKPKKSTPRTRGRHRYGPGTNKTRQHRAHKYPFTDLSSSKLRPALVLTPDQLLRKIDAAIFLFISSVMPAVVIPSDYILTTDHPSFPTTGLKVDSVFRAHKIITLHKSMVARAIGAADAPLMQSVTRCLGYALGM